jgi:spore germination protein KC
MFLVRKLLLIVLILINIISLSSCKKVIKGRVEIQNNLFIKTCGFDKPASSQEDVQITIISKFLKHSDNKSSSGEKINNIMTEQGKTIFEANRKFHTFSSKDIFWGQLEFILIGEEAAKDDINKYLDFVTRDHELRLTAKVFIIKENTARQIIENTNTSTFFISERLNNLVDDIPALSISKELTLADFIGTLDNKYTSAHVPYVSLVKKTTMMDENTDKYNLQLNGLAVFKKNKLFGYLDSTMSRGLNWILNDIDSGVIHVKDSKDNKIALEIINAKTKIIPKIKEGNLSASIKVDLTSNIVEQYGFEDIYNEKSIVSLEKQQETIISNEIQQVVKFAQNNQLDFLGIGDTIYHKYPIKWDNYKNDWNREFQNLDITVSVNSKISRVYVIKQPTKN